MTQQIPLTSKAIVEIPHPYDGTIQIASDLSYRRLAMVNVVFFGAPGCGDRKWVLIDTGVPGLTGQIESAAEERFGQGAKPAAIVQTHGHFDHVGGLESLAGKWNVPVYAHKLELPYLDGRASYPPPDPTVGGGIMPLLAPFFPRSPIDVALWLKALPANGVVPHMSGWRWLHTPGHAPGHISLWRESDRTLIAGDAFITTAVESAYAVAAQATEMHGPPMYFTTDWVAARQSVETLAALNPELIITGHGHAMHGPKMLGALRALARDFDEIAVPENGRYVVEPARAEDGTAYHKP